MYRFLTLYLKKILTEEKKNVYLSDLSYLSSEDEYDYEHYQKKKKTLTID